MALQNASYSSAVNMVSQDATVRLCGCYSLPVYHAHTTGNKECKALTFWHQSFIFNSNKSPT
jgi:hypothetical protein